MIGFAITISGIIAIDRFVALMLYCNREKWRKNEDKERGMLKAVQSLPVGMGWWEEG